VFGKGLLSLNLVNKVTQLWRSKIGASNPALPKLSMISIKLPMIKLKKATPPNMMKILVIYSYSEIGYKSP
jgi:hypothetical protein